jgi:hypothetical protein
MKLQVCQCFELEVHLKWLYIRTGRRDFYLGRL